MATTHQNEYHDAMVALLELLWGEGFMAPGGAGNVANMVQGLPVAGGLVLDIGSGLGGPACLLAEVYGARVVGIDLEAPLVARAEQRARDRGLADRAEFQTVTAGQLPFADETFDIVLSSGAFTQTGDKLGMFRDCIRVLRPGGWLTSYDWMRTDAPYGEDMQYWFRMEGLTYAMETLERHRELLQAAGFENVQTRDASDWYRRQVRVEYEQLRGALWPQVRAAIGEPDAKHFVENWRAMTVVCESGEMRQGYYRAQKPVMSKRGTERGGEAI